MNRFGWLGMSLTGFVIAAVVAAFLVIGSPTEARKRSADAQRISDLQSIARLVRSYYADRKVLPVKIQDLKLTYESPAILRDPVTKEPYGYRVLDKSHFELTAVFETDSTKIRPPAYSGFEGIPARHPKGRTPIRLSATREGQDLP